MQNVTFESVVLLNLASFCLLLEVLLIFTSFFRRNWPLNNMNSPVQIWMKAPRLITLKPTMIHSANPDHTLVVPQSHCWGGQATTGPTFNTAMRLT